MSMQFLTEISRLAKELTALTARVAALEQKPKPGRPKKVIKNG